MRQRCYRYAKLPSYGISSVVSGVKLLQTTLQLELWAAADDVEHCLSFAYLLQGTGYYYYYKSMLLECHTVKKTSRALNSKKIKSNSVTQFSQKSNEWLKSDVFSRRLKTDSDGDAVTSDGRLFQTRAAATPKARSPTVT